MEQITEQRGIGWAIKEMHNGARVSRKLWDRGRMWLELQVPDAHSKMTKPYIYIGTVYGDLVPWNPTQGDLLATDWDVVAQQGSA